MPAATEVRIRSIHAQNQASEHAMAGQRCALNLAAIARDEIHRGDWIADPRALLATTRVDVRLRLSARAAPLRAWAPCTSTGARCTGRPMWCCWRTVTKVMGSWCSWSSMHRSVRCVVIASSPAIPPRPTRWAVASCSTRTRHSGAARHGSLGWAHWSSWPQVRESAAVAAGALRHCHGRAATLLRAADRIDLPPDAQRIITREDTVVILASHWRCASR